MKDAHSQTDTPDRPRARAPRGLLPALLVAAGVLALAGAGSRLFTPLWGPPLVSLFSVTEEHSSVQTLEEIKTLLQFNTVQYVYRVVFPYDFMKEGISESGIWESWRRLRAAGGRTLPLLVQWEELSRAAENPEAAGFSPDEALWLRTWVLCRDLGLRYGPPTRHFVVSTIVVEAGFDFRGTVFEDPSASSAADLGRAFSVREVAAPSGQPPRRTAVLTLPPARITDIRIEDRDPAEFPDIPLQPAEWKRIADFLSTHYETRTVEEGILADARANASLFLREFLLAAGWDEVEINTGTP